MLIRTGQNHLVDGSLTNNRGLGVDVLSAIDQVLEIFLVGCLSCICKRLEDVAGVLVLCDLKGILGVGSRLGISTESGEKSRRLEITLV